MDPGFPTLIYAEGLLLWRIGAEIPDGFTIVFSTKVRIEEEGPGIINYGLDGNIAGGVAARRKICAAAGVPFENLTVGKQVHGTGVVNVGRELRGRGRMDPEDRLPGTDAMITGELDTPLAVLTADCLPVLLAAPGAGVAAIHAGWRGLLSGIIENTVRKLADELTPDISLVKAYLGPSICPDCFAAGEDVYGNLGVGYRDCLIEKGGSVHVDLWKVCRRRLEAAGVKPENIYCAGICTRCRKDLFYSYRGDRSLKGSNISLISRGDRAGVI